MSAREKGFPMGTTTDGRRVVVCFCGGGDIHEWMPVGRGRASMRIMQCPDFEPARKPSPDREVLA